MSTTRLLRTALVASLFASLGSLAFANTITIVGVNRDASLTDATQGASSAGVTGTPKAGDVADKFGGVWANEGAVNKDTVGGINDLFTVKINAPGTWGGTSNISGTWAIDSSFWNVWGDAVITMHVGNGNGDPDWFFFKIEDNATSGTFTYNRKSGGGGGISNLFLWGSGTPDTHQVPDAGSTSALLALGLAAVVAFRRRQS